MTAYTRYAYFEWALIFFDVLYDSIAEQEFAEADLQVCPHAIAISVLIFPQIYLATNQPDAKYYLLLGSVQFTADGTQYPAGQAAHRAPARRRPAPRRRPRHRPSTRPRAPKAQLYPQPPELSLRRLSR